jgi:hypothetical protein
VYGKTSLVATGQQTTLSVAPSETALTATSTAGERCAATNTQNMHVLTVLNQSLEPDDAGMCSSRVSTLLCVGPEVVPWIKALGAYDSQLFLLALAVEALA